MDHKKLSRETTKAVDDLVKRVAKKAGYSETGELTYQEHLQVKMENVQKKLSKKYQHQKRKLGFGVKDSDFAEEIKTYLIDGIDDLMSQGYSEEEAMEMTTQRFDEAEQKRDFEDFVEEFDDFGIQEQAQWYAQNGEAVGLFYAGFFTIGITVGAFLGYIIGGSLIYAGIGAVVGMGLGCGLGMLCHGVLVSRKKR